MVGIATTRALLRRKGVEHLLWLPLLCVFASSISACSSETPDVTLPAEWIDPIAREQSAVLFREDGTGTFTEFPLWNGEECRKDHATPYSGELRWEAVDGYFRVEAPNGPMKFKPKGSMLSDHWETLVVSICGDETPVDERITYQGTMPFDYY